MKTSAFGCDRWILPITEDDELPKLIFRLNRTLRDREFDLLTLLRVEDEDTPEPSYRGCVLNDYVQRVCVGDTKVLVVPMSPELIIPLEEGVQITIMRSGIHLFIPKGPDLLKHYVMFH